MDIVAGFSAAPLGTSIKRSSAAVRFGFWLFGRTPGPADHRSCDPQLAANHGTGSRSGAAGVPGDRPYFASASTRAADPRRHRLLTLRGHYSHWLRLEITHVNFMFGVQDGL